MAVTELEWLNQNRHRNYPLADGASGVSDDDDGGGRTLPTSFLCDMAIDVPPLECFNTGNFYLSEIVNLGETFQVCVRHTEISAVLFRSVPVRYDFVAPDDTVTGSKVSLYVTQEAVQTYPLLEQASGAFVIGSCAGMRNLEGAVFDAAAGELNPLVVRKGYAGLSRLIVIDSDGQPHNVTGDITLAAENGVAIAYDGKHKQITLTGTAEGLNESEYNSVDDVLNAIYKKLGIPITSINGTPPDSDGSFHIAGLDCTEVNKINNGITISNPCAKPCCPADTPADVTTTLKLLEDAKQILINYHEALLTNLQTMQSRLSSLIASRD